MQMRIATATDLAAVDACGDLAIAKKYNIKIKIIYKILLIN